MKNIDKKQTKRFVFVYPDFEYSLTRHGLKAEKGGWYHEGIAQLAAIIENLGWKADLIHLTTPIDKDTFISLLKEKKPDIIGFSVRTGVRDYAKDLINWADCLDKFIIVGSYHATLWPEEVISWNGVDALCIGEGENPVKELINRYDTDQPLETIGSLWIKDKYGQIHKNPVQPLCSDLDSLPLPKFDIFNFAKLIPAEIKAAIIVLTRGCPFNCTYCWNNFARNLYPNKQCYVRYRSPANCIAYIQKVMKQYSQVRSFRFQDDLWPFYNDWFDKFSLLYEKNIHMSFECHLRANLLNEKIIKRLREIKCFGIYFGVESGNDEIRNKVLKRNMTRETLINAFQVCKKYGIRTHAYNIIGLPHENMKKALDTIKLNAILEPTDMFFPIFFPYAGTELFDIAVRDGFYDPKKPLDPHVNIEMNDFKRNQIRFASLYSKTFVRLYQFCNHLPEALSPICEKGLDALWLFKYWPFGILIGWIVLKRKIEGSFKTFIKHYFFGLYLFLKK